MNMPKQLKAPFYIYEVNLTIEADTYAKNQAWLVLHFHDMVTQHDFHHLELFTEHNCDPLDDSHFRYTRLTAKYYIQDFKTIEIYLEKQSKTMRSQVYEKLGCASQIKRRVLKSEDVFYNPVLSEV